MPRFLMCKVKSFTEIFLLLILTTLFLLPPLKTLPIPQNTNGIIIIAIKTPANLLLEKFLRLLSIIFFYNDIQKQLYKLYF